MMLWLPMQAVSGISVPVCASSKLHAAVLDAQALSGETDPAHGDHAPDLVDRESSHHAVAQGASELPAGSGDTSCGVCTMACASFVIYQSSGQAFASPGVGRAEQGDASFASATGRRAFEPPITAA